MNNSLTSEYILSEVRKIQYLYGLKREVRYGRKRPEDDITESVAEHLYGMNLLVHYFLPLENPESTWDRERIFTMITVHDMEEIETGDTIGYLKTPEMRASGRKVQEQVIANAPQHLQEHFRDHLNEYEAQETQEARFVKAIDRIEPLYQTYSPFGKAIFSINKTRIEDSMRIKENYIKPFPVMYEYYRILQQTMVDEGYFYREESERE
jgi:putative hydrolases of HD superfamily